nr:MAG TPA: hypothetical protein [Microviridae sp.]
MNTTLMCFLEHLLCFNLHFSITSAKRSIAENKDYEYYSYVFS